VPRRGGVRVKNKKKSPKFDPGLEISDFNLKNPEKICKKTRVNSKKSGENGFPNLSRLIHLNFIKFV
jgi:hypothetical protein